MVRSSRSRDAKPRRAHMPLDRGVLAARARARCSSGLLTCIRPDAALARAFEGLFRFRASWSRGAPSPFTSGFSVARRLERPVERPALPADESLRDVGGELSLADDPGERATIHRLAAPKHASRKVHLGQKPGLPMRSRLAKVRPCTGRSSLSPR